MHTIMPTIVEFLANEVSREFARLKRAGVSSVDFSSLMTQIIEKNGIHDAEEISRMRSEISKIFAKKRTHKVPTQAKFKFTRRRETVEVKVTLRQLRLERICLESLEKAHAANEDICPVD